MRLWFVFFCGCTSFAQRPEVIPRSVPCVFSFRVVDRGGRELPYLVSSFVRSGTNVNVASSFRNLSADLPCGSYRYELRRSDVKFIAGRLDGTILGATVSAGLTLMANPNEIVAPDGVWSVSSLPFKGGLVRGRINGVGDADHLWIQLNSITSDRRLEARPRADGTFELWSSEADLFVVTVFRDSTAVVSQLLEVSRPLVELAIDIGSRVGGKP